MPVQQGWLVFAAPTGFSHSRQVFQGEVSMKRTLVSIAVYLAANGVGLLLAIVLIDGFSVAITAFLIAVILFTALQAIAGPIVAKLSSKYAPQLMGGISLVVIFLGLLMTGAILESMTTGGLGNLLIATLLVWIGSLAAQFGLNLAGFGTKPKA
jgi:hypothetical protein